MVSSGAKVLVQWLLLAICLMALVGGGSATTLCNIDPSKLFDCLPAVSGESPPPPNKNCCAVIHHANLTCLCDYKAALRALKIDPAHAVELPKKCGLNKPWKCNGKVSNFSTRAIGVFRFHCCILCCIFGYVWFHVTYASLTIDY